MTENERTAADTGPGPGPRPSRGAGPGAAVPGGYAAPGTDAGAAAGPGVTGPPHRFHRDRRHKVVAGVCAGLGRQCDMDPVIFRITLAVLSATGGLGLLF
ncbi:PspC domain-containing protein, partial [Streptomyces sp. TRM76130]|nr:PspC domain-containing protein [Streptomyces sp. TRM76130]